MLQTRFHRLTIFCLVLGLCFFCGPLAGQVEPSLQPPVAEKSVAALVSIQEVRVEPAQPGPETLCRLYVTLENRGEQSASIFSFAVEVGSESLGVYEKELYVVPLAAGAREELRLFNFWTSETGRPAPKNGELNVEVRLESAKWVKIERRENGEEIWTPAEKVAGLPNSAGLTLKLAAKPGAGD